MGLTCMNSDDTSSLFRRRGTSSSPWAGLVTWRRGVVRGVHWGGCVPWVV